MQDLNVTDHPYYYADQPDDLVVPGHGLEAHFRTDILYALRYCIPVEAFVKGAGAGMKSELCKRVRLVKACDQYHYGRDYDGSLWEDRCTDEAQYVIVDYSDGPNAAHASRACAIHADEALETANRTWCQVLLAVDMRPISG